MDETGNSKKSTNVTVEQIIEHMTADIQNADGQYIQLGFTPPPTPNEPHSWEYAQNQLPQNPFMPHFSPRSSDTLTYMDPNARYISQNVAYGNYVAQNAIYVPDIQNAPYDKHLNIDMHGNKYVLYPGQQPYVIPNQDIPVFMPVFPENRDYGLFTTNQEMHNQNSDMFLPQTHQDALKNKLMMHQNLQPQQQNRTHLIDNLVCNWAQNTNGTYSPFGNAPQNQQNFFESKPPETAVQPQPQNNKPQFPENDPDQPRNASVANSFKVAPVTMTSKKKQVAEVKPMRPTYSDVLTKSVPQTQTKTDRIEVKAAKSSLKKNAKTGSEKFSKVPLNRQSSTNGDKENQTINGQKFDKGGESTKVNLPRKWVSLDDVNEVHANDFFKVPDLGTEGFNSSKSAKKINNKRTEPKSDSNNKNGIKKTFLDNGSLGCQWTESEDVSESSRNDEKSFSKNPTKKGKDGRVSSVRQGRERANEKPPGSGKRGQRIRKRDTHNTLVVFGRTIQHYISRWSKIIFCILMWLLHLVSDIVNMSIHLGRDFGTMFWDSLIIHSKSFIQSTTTVLKRVKVFSAIGQYIDKKFGGYRWAFWKSKEEERRNSKTEAKNWLNSGLDHNIPMPSTGEEAMKRLLACKGKDPYSILGVRPDCTDDDIKRYYKRQAFLVHPDKNPQPGAEEAFKILVHAFDIIGEPERRQSYDRKVAESHQVEQAWSELNDLLSQLHQKMEYAANTIRCTNCSKRHRRLSVDRPCYAARMCSQCKIHHSAKEGDIWAEARYFGFLWHYYACMDGAVYDITEWAGCQRKNLKHLRPNSHNVQYRIVLGKQGQAGGSSSSHRRGHKTSANNSEREADLENFLNNLYNQSDMSGSANSPSHSDVNGRTQDAARNRKKNKRKK